MDVTELRQSAERFKQSLVSGNHYRIVKIMHALNKLNGALFVWVLFSQLLNREPLSHELAYYVQLLSQGTSKMSLIGSLIQSAEAERIYNAPHAPGNQNVTLASIINQFYTAAGPQFIEALYYEFLYREPDSGGYETHLLHLGQGVPRMKFVMSFLLSSEFQAMMAAALPPGETPASLSRVRQANGAMPPASTAKHVGLFMGYTQTIGKMLDGEGIGRFSMRLVEGLLLHADVVIHVAVMENNYIDLERSYRKLKALYPGRVLIHKFSTVQWLNLYLPVSVWIVPYVGMELALQLQKPIVLCIHDLVYMHFKSEYYKLQPDFCRQLDVIVPQLAAKASKAVFNSNFTRNHEGLQFLRMPSHKMHVIRLAAPTEEYDAFGIANEIEFRNKYRLIGPYITFPSVVRLHKNHDRLIEAYLRFRQSPEGKAGNYSLVLTDQLQHRPLEAEMTAALLRCTDLEARGSVKFIGRLPSHDVPSLYRYAASTVVPTLFEGSCPFPVMESLVMDTPVAASRLEVLNEVAGAPDAFVLFNPYSVEEMEQAIRQLIYRGKTTVPNQKAAIGAMLQRRWSDVGNEYYELVSSMIR